MGGSYEGNIELHQKYIINLVMLYCLPAILCIYLFIYLFIFKDSQKFPASVMHYEINFIIGTWYIFMVIYLVHFSSKYPLLMKQIWRIKSGSKSKFRFLYLLLGVVHIASPCLIAFSFKFPDFNSHRFSLYHTPAFWSMLSCFYFIIYLCWLANASSSVSGRSCAVALHFHCS